MRIHKTKIACEVQKFANQLFKKIGIAAFFALVSGFALTSVPVLAEPPECGDGQFKACEEELNTAQGELIGLLNSFIEEMENTQGMNQLDALRITNSQTGEESDLDEFMAKLGRQNDRAKEAIAESEESDFEEMIAQSGKEKDKNCKWKEADEVQENPEDYLPAGLEPPIEPIGKGDLGNGECDRFKAYNPEMNQMVSVNERSEPNICVQVCKDKIVHGQPKKVKIKERHIERKSESLDATKRAKAAVENAKRKMMTINVMADTFGPKYAIATAFPECERPLDVPQTVTWGVKVVLTPILVVLKINTRVAEGIQDSGIAVCQQDVAGFNVSATCIPAIVYYQVSQGLVDVTEFLIQAATLTNEGFGLFTANTTHECVKSIRTEQAAMMGLVTDIRDKVIDLEGKVKGVDSGIKALKKFSLENREYIKNTREIVLTPHGRRDEIPLYEAPLVE